jgi:Fic family protein
MNDQPLPRLDPRLARRLAEKKAALDGYRPLTPHIVRRLHDDLRILLTYHSNAIEGNTLSLRETQLIIEHGVTVGGHTLREYLEATNHAEAFSELITLADARTPITVETILELHRLTMATILDDAGRFRRTAVSIRGARLTPPPASQVPSLIAEWATWITGEGEQYPPIVRAAIAHHGFEAVHPFEDGNGRTGRLLLNLMLMRAEYPPALLLRDWRLGYIQALSSADSGSYQALANLIGRAVEGGLDLYLAACEAEPDSEYLKLDELARRTGYAAPHLGWLIRQGRLEAVKRGGRWYSTVAAVERYRRDVEQEKIPRGRPKLDQ